MHPEQYRLYCDPITQNHINNQANSKVILIGSCLGYLNFGDILQLKAARKWHQEKTGLEPVLVFDVASIREDHIKIQLEQSQVSIQELQQGKDWLESQYDIWKHYSQETQTKLERSHSWIQELQ